MEKKMDWKRLGWRQLTVITMLWNREMYGIEIQKRLKMLGDNLGPGQLYPLLNKLEKAGVLDSNERERKGANRIYYKTAEKGKGILITYGINFVGLFQRLLFEKMSFIIDAVIKELKIVPGKIMIDFSAPDVENTVLEQIAPVIKPTGRLFIETSSTEKVELLEYRIRFHELEDTVTPIEVIDGKVNLPDKSMDLATCIFTLHEEETDWIIPEIARVLKEDGKAMIIDLKKLDLEEENIIIETIAMLGKVIPRHDKGELGVDFEEIEKELKKNKLMVEKRTEEKGVVYLIVKPDNE
ncbi:MAG: helix-turn-helix transcriptional regulator [Candidatus Kariarchaeaceae archaeon]